MPFPTISHPSRPQRANNVLSGSSLALPTLPSQSAAPQSSRSKSRSRLRSLSNASKKFIAKFRASAAQEPVPPLPTKATPPPAPKSTSPPPPYLEHQRNYSSAAHSRASSSSTSSRPPLRERCNFQLTVTTTKSQMREKRDFMEDLNDQLKTLAALRSKGPRFSLLSPIHVSFPDSHTTSRTPSSGLEDVHEILPYLSVGFCDSRAGIPFKRFSHVVKIIYLGDEDKVDPSGRVWRPGHAHHAIDRENNCQVLTIAVPRPESSRGRSTKRKGSSKTVTRLTAEQLIYTRDFLSLALPYYAEAHPEAVHARGLDDDETRSADRVRVLICAPRECYGTDDDGHDSDSSGSVDIPLVVDDSAASSADVVSVVSCYLAYATDMSAVDMLDHFNEDPSAPAIWKSSVDEFSSVQFVSEVVGKESVSFPCRN